MSNLAGSQTEKNLLLTYAGESMVRIRYELFAERAKKEGHLQIAQIFQEFSMQERQHARKMFLALKGNKVQFESKIVVPSMSFTPENIEASLRGEAAEWKEIYPGYADVAEKEGFTQLAQIWRAVALAEKYHEKRFAALLQNLRTGEALDNFYRSLVNAGAKEESPAVRCLTCGYVAEDGIVPDFCPVCGSPSSKFSKLLG